MDGLKHSIGGDGGVDILASQRACRRVGVRRLAAVLLEFPAHPPSVPDAVSIPSTAATKTKKPTFAGELFSLMVEAGGIEPPSASTLQAVLHT